MGSLYVNKPIDKKRRGKGEEWEFGICRSKLLYIRWINYKILPHSTGNYIKYPVIKHHKKEYEKEYIYV